MSPSEPASRRPTTSAPLPLRYRAFISYSHTDTKWAVWLMRRLEGYRVPERFHGRAAPVGEVGARLAPVFRDRDELPTTSDLGEVVRAALHDSATLVVVCSPASAKSRWVREEIVAFKRRHGERRVFAFIIAGEPKAEGVDEDCFSPALRRELGANGELSEVRAEVVAADARPEADGKEDAFIRLIAGLLGVGFDDLRQRELHRRHRRMTWIAVGATAGMAITAGLAALAIVARSDAQRRQGHAEELIAVMLTDLKTGLQKADKLAELDEAGAKVMAYFQALKPRDLTDNTLAQQAKALTQIGEIRSKQLRYADASTAFAEAFKRSAALAERHPRDGDMLFERAQAEYWIGFVHWKKGDRSEADSWLTRYRDTGRALVRLNPAKQKWRSELASGQHNLAVLRVERGDLEGAHRDFLEKLTTLGEWRPWPPRMPNCDFA